MAESTNNHDNNTSSPNGEEEEHPSKKLLRSCDPDLKVIIKYYTEGKDGATEEKTKEIPMYAHVLSSLSKVVDTSLSVDMQEKETREITFHDVTPETFDLAIKFLINPLASRTMIPDEVPVVAEFYHKYQFTGGLELCDHVLSEYFQQQIRDWSKQINKWIKVPPKNLDFSVDMAVLADHFDLSKASAASISFLSSVLSNLTANMFTVENVKKLHPMFKRSIFAKAVPPATTQEELESPLFPKYFVTYHGAEMPHTVIVSQSGFCEIDGEYDRALYDSVYDHTYSEKLMIMQVPASDYDWAIVKKEPGGNILYFVSPYSRNLKVPPHQPWIPADEDFVDDARTDIIVLYRYDD